MEISLKHFINTKKIYGSISNSRFFLWLVLFSVIFPSSETKSSKWQKITPDGGERVVLEIIGNEWEYYRLEPGERMTYDVSDYSECRIITRADFRDTRKKELVYYFRLGWNDENGDLIARAGIRASKNVRLKGTKYRVGESQIVEFSDLHDNNKLTLELNDTAEHPVYFRVQYLKKEFTDETEYTSYDPSHHEVKVEIVTHETTSDYYLIDNSGKLCYEIIGPAILKINVRIAMDLNEKNCVRKQLDIYDNEKMKDSEELQFTRSKVSTFRDNSLFIPSKAETFYIEIPKGKHQYRFKLSDNVNHVYVRAYIPDDDLSPDS
ncbi:hypothetical protein K9N50_03675 [bacterium]|nr:hypothetical protein [bacterium]